LDDHEDKSIEEARKIRDEIKDRAKELVGQIVPS
jgi:hypothetical protein